MTDTDVHGAATGTGDRSRPRAVLPARCGTRITGGGIVYYDFPVLNPQVTHATGTGSPGAEGLQFGLHSAPFAGVHTPLRQPSRRTSGR
jgi:hypothetical protein